MDAYTYLRKAEFEDVRQRLMSLRGRRVDMNQPETRAPETRRPEPSRYRHLTLHVFHHNQHVGTHFHGHAAA